MKKGNRFINILLISFAVIFVTAAGIGEAWAYFTTYATAQGGYTIQLGYETEIEESFKDWTKSIEISNKEGSQPVYVRVRAYSGTQFGLEYSSDSWKYDETDGYWHYDKILYGGEKTDALKIKINNIPVAPEDGFEFSVRVIYQSTPVLYKEDGTPYPPDWTMILDTGESEGGNEG